jgi:hypothetical protein
MNSFFTLHSFLEVGKTQDLPSKIWQTLGDALMSTIALEKVASDVAEGVTPHCVARLVRDSRHGAWRDQIGSGV